MSVWREERPVNVQDVLEYFDSRSQVPSANIGGVMSSQSPSEKQERREVRMLQGAAVLRCVDKLLGVSRLPEDWNATAIARLGRKHGLGDGEVTVAVLSCFGPWRNSWVTQGYAAVHTWRARLKEPNADAAIAQEWREGKHADDFASARTLVDEANAVIGLWVRAWGGVKREGART